MERLLAPLLLALAALCALRAFDPALPAGAGPGPPGHARREPGPGNLADTGAASAAPSPVPPDASAPRGDDVLRFEPAERDLGRIDAGASAVVEFPWRRGGSGDLRVLALETDCACAVASGLPGVVPEGASGTLVLDIRGRSRPGPFVHVVRLRVDRAPDAVLRLRVRGFVGSAIVVEPPVLDLGRVAAGREVAHVVTVRPPPAPAHALGDAPDDAAGGAPGESPGGAPGDAPGDARVEARLVDVAGACDVRGPAHRGVSGADVVVRVRVPDRPGPFAGHVEVRVAREGVWRVPLRGEAAVPAAPASPGPGPPDGRQPGPAVSPEALRSVRHSR